MNYHSDEWIMAGVQRHYEEVQRLYRPEQIVAVMYSGSANYYADYESSDIDTWAVIIDDNWTPETNAVITHHYNGECIWLVDIRCYMSGLLYSDVWYLLPLYSKYNIYNELYYDLFLEVVQRREEYAHNDTSNVLACIQTRAKQYGEYFETENGASLFFSKRAYYLMLEILIFSTYIKQVPFGDIFYNEQYGKLLKEIKICADYDTGKSLYFQLQTMIQTQRARNEAPKNSKKLGAISNSLVNSIFQRYKGALNGYSNKN